LFAKEVFEETLNQAVPELEWVYGMDGKIKFLTILLAALLVSAITSYATTFLYLESMSGQSSGTGNVNVDVNNLPPEMVQQISDEIVMEVTKTNVSLPFEVDFFAGGNSLITVHSQVTLENLTIVYQYTNLSDGSVYTESIDYGTFIPAWGAGAVIKAGESPEAQYQIPPKILEQCAKIIVNSNDCDVFEGTPQLEVLGVFGYA
jgi:hypothetical protein